MQSQSNEKTSNGTNPFVASVRLKIIEKFYLFPRLIH